MAGRLIRGLNDWIEERVELSIALAFVRKQMAKPIPKHVNWLFSFGTVTFAFFIMQVISGLLLMSGRRLPSDHRPRATGVYDINAIELIKSAAAIREGDVLAGENLPGEPDFFIGTFARVLRDVDEWQPVTLLSKSNAGAQFIQLQVCMNPKSLQNYMSRLVAAKLTWRCQVLASLAVFSSADEARLLRKTISDVMVPRDVVQRLENSKDPKQEGIQICAEQLQLVTEIPGIAGATVMAPGDPASIAAAIEASGVRADL